MQIWTIFFKKIKIKSYLQMAPTFCFWVVVWEWVSQDAKFHPKKKLLHGEKWRTTKKNTSLAMIATTTTTTTTTTFLTEHITCKLQYCTRL
jgi:hypothetical protein